MPTAAVFVLLGQSNAVNRANAIPVEAQIRTPMRNVFGLSRTYNQSFDIRQLTWSGYTSNGMNLGQTCDDTYTVATCLAQLWQEAIDAGEKLPDLYIVHIAIGAQGVTEQYMWYPDRPIKLIPGEIGVADIALAPFTNHILSLLKQDFDARGIEPDFVGIHWRGGEQEDGIEAKDLKPCLYPIYCRLFEDMFAALGRRVPVVLHRLVHDDWCAAQETPARYYESVAYINEVFERLIATYPDFSMFDARKAPFYIPKGEQNGLFHEDLIHYTTRSNQWTAKQILAQYQEKKK